MSLRIKVLNLFLLLAIGGIIIGILLLKTSHTDFSSQDPIAEFEAYNFNQFVLALNEAERGELGNNVYAIDGKVESLSQIGFILKGGIVCTTADSTDLGLKEGEQVSIKGRFISFDELFGEIRLDHVVAL